MSKLRAYAAKNDAVKTAEYLVSDALGVESKEMGVLFLLEAVFDEDEAIPPQIKAKKDYLSAACPDAAWALVVVLSRACSSRAAACSAAPSTDTPSELTTLMRWALRSLVPRAEWCSSSSAACAEAASASAAAGGIIRSVGSCLWAPVEAREGAAV